MLKPGENISSLPMAFRTSSGTSLAGVYRLSFFILSKEVLLTGVLPPLPPAYVHGGRWLRQSKNREDFAGCIYRSIR